MEGTERGGAAAPSPQPGEPRPSWRAAQGDGGRNADNTEAVELHSAEPPHNADGPPHGYDEGNALVMLHAEFDGGGASSFKRPSLPCRKRKASSLIALCPSPSRPLNHSPLSDEGGGAVSNPTPPLPTPQQQPYGGGDGGELEEVLFHHLVHTFHSSQTQFVPVPHHGSPASSPSPSSSCAIANTTTTTSTSPLLEDSAQFSTCHRDDGHSCAHQLRASSSTINDNDNDDIYNIYNTNSIGRKPQPLSAGRGHDWTVVRPSRRPPEKSDGDRVSIGGVGQQAAPPWPSQASRQQLDERSGQHTTLSRLAQGVETRSSRCTAAWPSSFGNWNQQFASCRPIMKHSSCAPTSINKKPFPSLERDPSLLPSMSTALQNSIRHTSVSGQRRRWLKVEVDDEDETRIVVTLQALSSNPPRPSLDQAIITIPRTYTHETTSNLFVFAELTGVRKRDIALSFDQGALRVMASRQATLATMGGCEGGSCDEGTYYMVTMPLPAWVEDRRMRRVKITFSTGLLELCIPKDLAPADLADDTDLAVPAISGSVQLPINAAVSVSGIGAGLTSGHRWRSSSQAVASTAVEQGLFLPVHSDRSITTTTRP